VTEDILSISFAWPWFTICSELTSFRRYRKSLSKMEAF